MKTKDEPKTGAFALEIPGIALDAKGQEVLKAARKVLRGHSEALGLLDALDAEPAVVFIAEEGKR
jgi:hypothetical protein